MDARLNEVVDTLLSTDAYKLEHKNMYPKGTQTVFSNLTARGTRIKGIDVTVFFGLQAFLKRLKDRWEEFFNLTNVELDNVLVAYETVVCDLLGVESFDTSHFEKLHDLGYLPLRVKAFREGALVPLRVPYLTIENTHPQFFWLTNYLETELSAEMWQPITSATLAWRNRQLLDKRAQESGDETLVEFQGHDFSCRGMEGMAAAGASSAGHLLSFKGTDTLAAIRYVQKFYDSSNNGQIASSCPATEHSIMCAGGREGEFDTYERLVDMYPDGILSIVSDTWDLWSVLTEFLPKLKDKILTRNGKLVVRPDSGDPETILCGDLEASPGSPEHQGVVRLLADTFGTYVNDKGYMELDSHVGVIYGDSIHYERADAITRRLMDMGFASTSVVFGFGSYTYQYQTRDTFKMAVKATWVKVNGEGRDILKDPITDDGTKKSATGRLAVRTMMSGEPYLIEHASAEQEAEQRLIPVFDNGKLLNTQSFSDIRENLVRETGIYQRRGGMCK